MSDLNNYLMSDGGVCIRAPASSVNNIEGKVKVEMSLYYTTQFQIMCGGLVQGVTQLISNVFSIGVPSKKLWY